MSYKVFIFASVMSIAALAAGCGGTETPANTAANNANTTAANTAGPAANTNNPLAVVTPTPAETINNAPTLTPVYKAYCDAYVKKDEAALRRVFSSDTIKFFEAEMKADGVSSLVEFLADDQVSPDLCEVRNERITGDKAIGEIRSKGYPNGIDVIFVKENGEWKLTNSQPQGALK